MVVYADSSVRPLKLLYPSKIVLNVLRRYPRGVEQVFFKGLELFRHANSNSWLNTLLANITG